MAQDQITIESTTSEPSASTGEESDPIRHWVELAMTAADNKLGTRTEAYMVGDIIGITEWFVMTSGGTDRQLGAIVRNVEQELTEAGGPKPQAIEGRPESGWVLMDYGSFVVHVFDASTRDYYELERLWQDVPRIASPVRPQY